MLLGVAWAALCSDLVGQTEATSPIYSFSIRKKVEPPILELVAGSLQFIDEDGNGALDANEACSLQFSVTNDGLGDGYGLQAIAQISGATSDIRLEKVTDLPVAHLGEVTTFSLPLTAGMNTVDGRLELSIEVTEPNGFGLDAIVVDLEVRAFQSPQLEVVDFKLRGEGQLRRKAPFALEVLLQNTGQGLAEDVNAQLRVPNGVFLLSDNASIQMDALAAGESVSLLYDCIINNTFAEDDVRFAMEASEAYGKFGADWDHTFQFDDPMSSERLVIEADDRERIEVERMSLSSDVDRNIPNWGAPLNQRYAVVIGNEDYASRSGSLSPEVDVDFAENDAQVMAEYFKQAFGVPSENMHLLLNATAGEMRREINWLTNVARAEDGQAELYFYYSGHGLPAGTDNVPYLIPVDVDGQQPTLGVSLPALYRDLTQHPVARAHVFLDACFSGGARNEELVAMKGIRVVPKADAIPEGLLVWASSSGNQASGVYREQFHGHFTYQLLKSLQSAEPDLTLGELFDQIQSQVDRTTARAGFMQTPEALAAPANAQTWPEWTIR